LHKILFIVGGSYFSGLERMALNVMKGLKHQGYTICCIINGWNDGVFKEMLQGEGIDHHEIKIGSIYLRKPHWTLDTLIHYPIALYRFFRINQNFKPDVLFHYSYRTFLMLYPALPGCRNYFHVHEHYRGWVYRNLAFPLLRKKVYCFATCSEYIRDTLIASGIESGKVTAIHNGIEIRKTNHHRVPGKIFQIGIAGQIIPRKGHRVLIEALGLLISEENKFILNIYGNGDDDYINELKSRIGELKLTKRILWHGFLKDTHQIYSMLDLVVVPTVDEEPFGLTALEPAQYKIPVVVSNVGGLKEIVTDGYNGYYFMNNNSRDLAEKIKLFLEDPNSSLNMGENHYNLALKKFTSDQMIRQFVNLLKT